MRMTQIIRRKLAQPAALPLHTDATEFLQTWLAVSLRRLWLGCGGYDSLTRLAAKYKSDKGVTIFPFHGYTEFYTKLFERFRQQPINILEIGLARRDDRATLGIECPSLSMWLDYFPRAQVYGFDLDDFSWVSMPRTRVFRGDQGSAEDLRRVVATCPQFDLIIDDGSHASYHQHVTLKTLFPHLRSGGLFVIEDLSWQPKDLEASLPSVSTMRNVLKDRGALETVISGVGEVMFFDSPILGDRESVAAIVKA